MSTTHVDVGFIPLVDAAPMVVAHELGFAEEEGLALNLRAAPSWSTLRDMLAIGQIEAAHMLAPLPVAMALGLTGTETQIDILQVLSVNGNAIGVSSALAAKMRLQGYKFDFTDAVAAGRALIAAAPAQLKIGVPFTFSMHAELLYHWMGALGLSAPADLDVRTVPPHLMAEAMAEGEIDAFCVGAPWGSLAVETNVGELLLPGSAVRAFSPEKVLAVRHNWAATQPDVTARLMRATWRAGRWLAQPENRVSAAEILAAPNYLNVPAEVIERSLAGNLVISQRGEMRHTPNYLEFFEGAATYPWASQVALIAARLAARAGLERKAAMEVARKICRTDLYHANLGPAGAVLPNVREKREGAITQPMAVATEAGQMILAPDAFFDGWIFDPAAPE